MTPIYKPYQPQLVPVAWASDVWIVDGPEVNYTLAGVIIPCPTRMTVVRLIDGSLWLHSPVSYSGALALELEKLGTICAIVAPNSYHFLHIAGWADKFPAAAVFAPPELSGKIKAKTTSLSAITNAPWRDQIICALVELDNFTEAIFFHAASRTLLLTDLMQNFEAERVSRFTTRALLKAGGATGPNGRPSIEIRMAARGHRDAMRAGVRQMLDWRPESIIISHGACFRKDARLEIERAFDWVEPCKVLGRR